MTQPGEITLLLDVVRAEALAVLRGIHPDPVFDVNRSFTDLGMDSLALVELHARLNAALGLSLPVTIAFDYPRATSLAEYLRREMLGLTEDRPLAIPSRMDIPVAVVGIGCRFPGGISSPDDLWRLVAEGGSAITDVPTDRGWEATGLGGFLKDATRFDAEFFGISPREATAMEPQQRLLLETAWEALERAGIDPMSLRGSRTGVFVGAGMSGYAGSAGHRLTGTALSIASGRVAYFLGLHGPALTLDTACSGSLVALHLAAESVRQGECSLALAGGVTVLGSPELWDEFRRQGGLAGDGRVKAFSAGADGTSFAEGSALLVVERLSDARRNGRPVLAVVRGSAINQDGASNGLTAPSGTAQRRLIRTALAVAGLTPEDVAVVEAHGTGTELGDPVEAQAILATYGKDRPTPLWLGSVKSNIGHTQAAAGAAGVIKMIMAMRHGTLPRTINVDQPSPRVDWSVGNVRLLTEPVPWERGDEPRRAAISGFGISGTNAHVIIEEPPDQPPAEPPAEDVIPVVVSAKSAVALDEQIANVKSIVDVNLMDLGYSLAVTRAALPERAVVIAGSHNEFMRADMIRGHVTEGRFGLAFPAERPFAMAMDLYSSYPVFARAFDDAVNHLLTTMDRLDDRAETFAVQVAMFRLVESWGMRPDFVTGQAVGELAAMHAAGVLSLEDAALLVGAREDVIHQLTQLVTFAPRRIPMVPNGYRDGDTYLTLDPDLGQRMLLTRVAEAYVRGARLNWEAFYAGTGARRIPLPTYPFQRKRFWAHEPMLSSVVHLASGGIVLTGRVSTLSHPWLADHVIAGRTLMPGTAFVEMALRAGTEMGCPLLAELTMETPLVLGESPVALQVVARDMSLEIYSKADDVWVRHATGRFETRRGMPATIPEWPPKDAQAVDVAEIYAASEHGPAFRGLRAAWRRGAEIFAEVDVRDPDRFAALLDAAMHAAGHTGVPFIWERVAVHTNGFTSARVHIVEDGDRLSMSLTDMMGVPVASVGAVTLRDQVRTDPPLRREWLPLVNHLEALDPAGVGTYIVPVLSEEDTPGAAHAVTAEVLGLIQAWLAEDSGQLVVVTQRAVAVRQGEDVDMSQAPVSGLVRAAQAANPGRFVLVDVDELSETVALAVAAGEPELAIRERRILVPTLVPATETRASSPWRPDSRVLITGGTGALGAHLARHLVRAHGVEHLVLVSRRGMDAPGAAELVAELGVDVAVVACDVSDRYAVAALLAEHPVTAVVHAAGVVADGSIGTLTSRQVDTVMRPKVDAAWHLHSLVGEVSAFVLYSSLASIVDEAGNAFLAALAAHRQAQGMAGISLAWGPWVGAGGMSDTRARRLGVEPMSVADSLAMMDRALLCDDAMVVAARFRRAVDHPTPTDQAVSPEVVVPPVADEPIAIVGMACRYPGDIRSPEDLWQMVAAGEDVIADYPTDRGWTSTGRGGFLSDAAMFDADFFGISPRAATAMDPQQRLLLEIAWETFERAGIDPQSMRGSDTGVFAGVMYHDYGDGNAGGMVSGRVAYTLGLEGPAVTVDTACSSSLVAMHWAMQALRRGECGLALAGGVTVMSTSDKIDEMGADGTGWGEGVGLVLLERLPDAQRNGRKILAVVRGSAVNSDGASNGVAAPSGPAQQRVIRQALASAGLTPSDVDAVEGHGIGTALGDPIEAQALMAVYGYRDEPLWLGSVKSNMGHTQAAAGIAGVIKMVMAMRHGTLPRTLHAERPSMRVDWTAGDVRLLADGIEWPVHDRPRRAGISSFGNSGTNAHVIIEQAPAMRAKPGYGPAVMPWILSATSPAALLDQADRLRSCLDGVRDDDFARVGRSLATTRAAFEHRAVVIGSTRDEFAEGLETLRPAQVVGGRTAFVFAGQGAQRLGMGRELYGTFPAFAQAFDAVVAELDDLSLREVMWGEDRGLVHQTVFAQAALFAVEVALARLAESWGVRPDFVAGHSVGEIAAAHIAGIFSLPDAAKLVSARGRLMQALPAGGAMIALQAAEVEVTPLLTGDVSLAAVNGPMSVVISGAEAAVTRIAQRFSTQGRRTTRLEVSHAFHSALMEPMLDEFRAVVAALTFLPPRIAVVAEEMRTAGYWVRQVRDTVRFADMVRYMEDRGVRTFLEVGPDAVMDGFIPLMRRDRDEERQVVEALALAYSRGTSVDWGVFYGDGDMIDLPTYAFQHKHYWQSPARRDVGAAGLDPVAHPMLSAATVSAESGGVVLSGRLSVDAQPWLADHRVLGTTILPGTAFLELAIRAGDQVGCDLVAELTLEAPLALTRDVAIQVVVGADESGRRSVRIFSRRDDGPWTRHATGYLTTGGPELMVELAEWPPPGAIPVPLDGAYERLRDRGYEYGPAFQGMRMAWRRGDELFAEVDIDADIAHYGVHPALLNAAMHVDMLVDEGTETLLPFAWIGVSLQASGATALRVWIRRIRGAEESEMMVTDENGQPVMSVAALNSRAVSSEQLGAARGAMNESMYRIDWVPAPGPRLLAGHVVLDTPMVEDLVARQEIPAVVIAQCPVLSGDVPYTARALANEVLELLRTWLADERFEMSKLVVVTTDDLGHAPVVGLVRAAQAEHPGRIGLVDWDGMDDDALLAAAASGEPELAVRGTELRAPRLVNVLVPDMPAPWDPDGTVLITGGGFGAAVARDLRERGIRNMLLVNRSGTSEMDIPAVACDVTDREALASVIASIPADRPLRAVIHAAAVTDPGVIESMTPSRMESVLRPKIDGAWHLHELTKDMDLTAFVLMSSAGGLVMPEGQGNYAAANVFLDALATNRRSMGLPAVSLAFGKVDGVGRPGLPAMSLPDGIEFFHQGVCVDSPVVVPLLVDRTAMRGEVPAMLRGAPGRRVVQEDFTRKLVSASNGERDRMLMDLVRKHAAAVLGHDSIPADTAFHDLGLDSLTALEMRNSLSAATGLRLPATLVFDHRNAHALAEYLKNELTGGSPVAAGVHPVPSTPDEPIAIVGMSCRYPGGVRSPEDLWHLVAEGVDAIASFPTDRGWTASGLGGFLYDAAEFDSAFFGIPSREAMAMDPQQRLLLEVTWETFERAGIDPKSMRGSQTGVYAGVMYHDYGDGNAGSVASGRVAYTFGLEGPAVTVDTACSSSLVALHMACQALRSGEVTMALAGGVTVMPTPEIFAEVSKQLAVASDGRCKPFSAAADGTSWAEGIGLLLVERLADARRNGHPVLAVIRGSAVNQDGASNGMTAPNGPAQQRVITRALAAAGLRPSDVDMVEAHGTGTRLGDPIEAQALMTAYGHRDEPLWLGSVKSNIGHTQAAAGVAGVIKMVMAMRHGQMPRTLHVDAPSPHVDWSAGSVRLLTEDRAWSGDRVRRAGVSSFGISGTNAHVILEQAPVESIVEVPDIQVPVPLLISAADSASLSAQASILWAYLDADPDIRMLDLAYSLATSRAALEHRAVIPAKDRYGAMRGLVALSEDRATNGVVQGNANSDGLTAFLFTGQGAQRTGMGHELYETFPAFAEAFDAVATELDKHLDLPLREVMWGESDNMLNQAVFTQAGVFALEVALYRLVESWGVRPDFLAGHSIGELSAAYVAGVWSLADAAKLVAARGRLMQALSQGGAMVALQATEAEVRPWLSDRVAIAAVNGPHSVVVSGDEESVVLLAQQFADQDRRATRLRVSHAFHSPLMDPMLSQFLAVATSVTYHSPRIPVVSNVTGRIAIDLTAPEYWVRHVRETVRFADGIECLSAAGVTTFVELGPDGVLSGMTDVDMVPILRRGREEVATLVNALARMQVSGMAVDWDAYFAGTGARRVDLPTYAFQRTRYWLDSQEPVGDAVAARHPLLSAIVPSASAGAPMLTGRLSLDTHPWLADHRILGVVTLPGAAYVEMALRAGQEIGCDVLEELVQEVPMEIPDDGDVSVQVVLDAEGGVSIYSRMDDLPWVRNAHGVLSAQQTTPTFTLRAWPPAGAKSVDVSGLYEDLAALGYGYGPMFQGVRAAWRRGDDVFAEIRLPVVDESFSIHPALLDAALHAERVLDDGPRTTLLPFSWTRVSLHAAGASTLRVRVSKPAPASVSLAIADDTGQPVASVESLSLREISPGRYGQEDSLYRIAWNPIAPGGSSGIPTYLVSSSVDGDVLEGVHEAVGDVLRVVQEWLASSSSGPLAIVTAAGDLRQTPVWGVVRAAEAEHPGRFILVETDGSMDVAAAVASGEPEIAIRSGVVSVPRLVRATVGDEAPPWRTDGTVLITGGTGLLGSLTALHLMAEHGVRHLVLASRRGIDTPGAAELRDGLVAMGASVWMPAVDMSDRCAVAEMLAEVPAAHPLTGIVHAAGVMENGLVSSMTPDQMDRVLAAKADAAWHLHELTEHLDLSAFVMYSSAGGMVLAAGQANYAAANVFLDALAAHRRGMGLPGTSLAWGPWEGLTSRPGPVDIRRLDRSGMPILSFEDGLALLDLAVRTDEAVLVPVNLNLSVWRSRQDAVPALLRGLVGRPVVSRASGVGTVALVCEQVAAVVGYSVDPALGFVEMGMDSLGAIEVRNRLQAITGLRLPATVVFDCPNAIALGEFLDRAMAPVESGDDEIRERLASISLDRMREAGVLEMLLEMADLTAPAEPVAARLAAIEDMDLDDLVRAVLESEPEEEGDL
ncbi:type I polyketide synthase [Actinocrispum wychmicini]|uniref:6-deoxyerythronolide-B synthase n=1 Tax=Actinocrispum wychmicini TaxID=1213861 RepID=A0A4R2J6J1_9PSEU|nr:type I polyketide synthase [Actinocrispum wychmicini]TCO53677.1 acyl transferase domain-containing protein [Actinocrispum wychmicini]